MDDATGMIRGHDVYRALPIVVPQQLRPIVSSDLLSEDIEQDGEGVAIHDIVHHGHVLRQIMNQLLKHVNRKAGNTPHFSLYRPCSGKSIPILPNKVRKEIVFIHEMGVECRSSDQCLLAEFVDRDILKGLSTQQLGERSAEHLVRSSEAKILFFGHRNSSRFSVQLTGIR